MALYADGLAFLKSEGLLYMVLNSVILSMDHLIGFILSMVL